MTMAVTAAVLCEDLGSIRRTALECNLTAALRLIDWGCPYPEVVEEVWRIQQELENYV